MTSWVVFVDNRSGFWWQCSLLVDSYCFFWHIAAVRLKSISLCAAVFFASMDAIMAPDVNQFYDGSTVLEPLSKATELPIDQVPGIAPFAPSLFAMLQVWCGTSVWTSLVRWCCLPSLSLYPINVYVVWITGYVMGLLLIYYSVTENRYFLRVYLIYGLTKSRPHTTAQSDDHDCTPSIVVRSCWSYDRKQSTGVQSWGPG